MKRSSIVEIVVFSALLASGVGLRIGMQDIPNFAPVAGMALFAGFFFRWWVLAAALPLAIMALSDYWIGGYAPPMMALVYGMLTLPVACRGLLRGIWNSPRYSTRKPLAGLVGCSFVASCLFFLVTNFGSWLWFDMYDPSFRGLVECYVAAVPFFRYTLAGDLFYALVLFSGYNAAWYAGLVPSCTGRQLPAAEL